MKALWIRVEAHEVDSRHISRFAVALGVKKVHALGHYAALGGAIAEHTEDGRINDVDDVTLEEWGRWDGKPGKLAKAVRDTLQGSDGTFSDWLDSMGKLVDRRARDRERKEEEKLRREADRANRAARVSTEIPRKGRGNSTETGGSFQGKEPVFRGNSTENASFSAATERNGTERNGTVKADSGKREGENSSASASLRSETGPAPRLPTGCQAFLDRFYPVTGRRRTDVERQLTKLAAGDPVTDGKKQSVRAYSADRLEEKCLDVIAESSQIRDLDKAIVVLFTKLGDTSDGSAPGQREAESRAAPDPDEQTITTWIREHPADVAEIRTELAGGGPVNPFAEASMDAQLRARVRTRLFAHSHGDAS